MKQVIMITIVLFFTGCLYFNDRGVSAHLYDNCHSYYDENGNFIESCDENIIDYDEAQEGVIAIKDEISKSINRAVSSIKEDDGIDIKELSQEDRKKVIKEEITEPIKEQVESNQCPCK
jgi:hypothetical protein